MGETNPYGETNVYIADLPSEVDDAALAQIFGQYGTVTWSKVMASQGKPSNVGIVEYATADEATWFVENLNGNIPEGLTTPITASIKKGKKWKGKEKGDKGKGKGFGKASSDDGGKGKGASPYGGKSDAGKQGGKQAAWQPTWGGKGGADSGKQAAAWKGAGKGKEAQAATPQYDNSKNVYINGLPAEVDDNGCKEIFGQYGTVTWSKVMPAKEGKPTTVAIVEFSTVEESQWFVENLNGNIPEGLTDPIECSLKKDRPPKGGAKGKSNGKGGW